MKLLFLHALSPLHAGTGQSVGAIDLAIARDRATGYPYVPSSSIKGALRDLGTRRNPNVVKALFGPEPKNGAEHAGALILGDANLLCMPVRSVAGTFAWVTSPWLLSRFERDVAEAGVAKLPVVAAPAEMGRVRLAVGSKLVVGQGDARRVILEDLDLVPEPAAAGGNVDPPTNVAKRLAEMIFPLPSGNEPGTGQDDGNDAKRWHELFCQRFCVVHDDVMSFLSEHATDVVARVALKDDSKTVDNLWHEESLPSETILVSVVDALPNAGSKLPNADSKVDGRALRPAELLNELAGILRPGKNQPAVAQFGGKATVGRGRCRVVLS
jgi:CRISPR-associated protein Cmr4